MGAFAITPKTLAEESLRTLLNGFSKRGFSKNEVFTFNDFNLVYFSKLNDVSQIIAGKGGSVVVAAGTLWYKNLTFSDSKRELLDDLETDNFDPDNLSGTYCLLYVNSRMQLIHLYHDAQGVYRFYHDTSSGIISSSWLSLVWLKERLSRNINVNAVLENLILGFNLGNKTWVTNIDRVQAAKNLQRYVKYYRTRHQFDTPDGTEDFKVEVKESAEILCNVLNSKLSATTPLILGLSSGYDSRLVTSVLSRQNYDRLRFFTFYKPGDKDLEIAKKIAGFCRKELKIIETKREISPEAQQDVFEKAFHFFDGQCAVMMQYSKLDYTRKFRSQILTEGDLHLSGVGGELFRNYTHDHSFNIPWKFWINQYFNGGYLPEWLEKNDAVLDKIIEELKVQLNTEAELISFKNRKRFYGEVFLSDWHGVRNTIENQYSNYYSPFTDPSIINQGIKTRVHHGSGGQFEASMIAYLSPDLAMFESEYGHNFLSIPYSSKLKNNLGAWSKIPGISVFRRFTGKPKRSLVLSAFEESLVDNVKSVLREREIDVDMLLKFKKEQVLVAGYVLHQIKN